MARGNQLTARKETTMRSQRLDTVVIGGGQAGLAVGYHLARQDRDFVILDAGQRVGAAWRHRSDSLRLFTPARFNHLPGMPFPAPGGYFPIKDEMADYLEAYAARFHLPGGAGGHGRRAWSTRDLYLLTAGRRSLEAHHVVVATGAAIAPRVPTFAEQLDPAIVQLHSADYRNPVSCATVPSWSSGRATPAPRSRWSWHPPTTPGWPAGTPAASPSPSAAPSSRR
jgi:putative flavoprotein involved in K+ transport